MSALCTTFLTVFISGLIFIRISFCTQQNCDFLRRYNFADGQFLNILHGSYFTGRYSVNIRKELHFMDTKQKKIGKVLRH